MISGSFESVQARAKPDQCQKRTKPFPFTIKAILGDEYFKNERNRVERNRRNEEKHEERLREAPQEKSPDSIHDKETNNDSPTRFGWLDCTRYKPPKVPRSKKRRGTTSRPSRQPRVPFTPYQQATLENKFQIDHYLTSSAVNELSLVLSLPEQRIKIWFQNRRARERREIQQKTDSI